MRFPNIKNRTVSGFLWWASSVPVYIKILGIGFLVAILFGAVTYYQLQVGVSRAHYRTYGETALSVAQSLAPRVEASVARNDIPSVDGLLNETMATFPYIRYIVVLDGRGKMLSHGFTFPKEAPADLVERQSDLCAGCHPAPFPQELPLNLLEVPGHPLLSEGSLRAYRRPEGMVLEVALPLSDGGALRLGIADKVVAREMYSLTRRIFWSLAICVLVGQILAMALAYFLVRPIRNLVRAADRIREGDFKARAEVSSEDEIGALAVAFNQMAESIETYRKEVEKKEAAHVLLLGKIVQAQERERKSIARELHDQLGQSLSNTLLSIESRCKGCPARSEQCEEIKSTLRGLIDQVRRLAWDARPSILDDYGLDMALARYAEEMSRRLEFLVDYQCVMPPGSGRLPDRVEVTLYRIAQEAVTNIARHAAATQASIVLLRHDHEIDLVVEDNGRGFEVGSVATYADNALGLLGMKERAALLGGDVSIDSGPGQGTTVHVKIPLGGSENGDPDTPRR